MTKIKNPQNKTNPVYINLKNQLFILNEKLRIIIKNFKRNKIAFKRLLKNYMLLKKKYLLLQRYSTKKVNDLIEEINRENYQMIFDENKNLLSIPNDFLEEIEMSKNEFESSFYVDILFDKYFPQPEKKSAVITITPFQFPIMIKNFTNESGHIHPYVYFKISGKIEYDKKVKKYLYFLTVEDVSSSVELDYFQKTDTLITSLSISNFNLMKAKKTIEMHKIMIMSLTCSLIGEYSKETSMHLTNLRTLTGYLSNECKRLGLIKVKNYDIEEFVNDINFTSVLHDIGKMAIPNEILDKDGILTPEERTIIQKHPLIGASYIQKIIDMFQHDKTFSSYINFLKIPYDICKHHHEKWDGTGYPSGLKGNEIPISARIVSIVDTYEALRGYRIYNHKRKSHEQAIEIIKKESGKQFDPEIVEAFLNINQKFNTISYEFVEI
jgi:HD-GYP domain-containing protein (c-di-GMP phosphodiesterase class II)